MPFLTRPKPNRRDFLKTAGLSMGAVLAGGCTRVRLLGGKPHEPTHWALTADTHVSLDPNEEYRKFVIDNNTKTAVRQIVEAAPEGAVIIGDCARLKGRLYDYDMLWRLLRPLRAKMPAGLAMGNHDDRKNFRKVFHWHAGEPAPVEDKHVLVVDVESAGVRFILLDSLRKVNETAGTLGDAQRRWLSRFLDEADRRPTFLFFHHPPIKGKGNLLDHDALFEIILPRRQVKAVFFGHSHVYRYAKVEDVDLINIPAVGYNFSDKVPVGWIDARISTEGAELTLRAFAGNTADNGKMTSLKWRGLRG